MVNSAIYIGDTQTFQAPVFVDEPSAKASFRLIGPTQVEIEATRKDKTFVADLTHEQSKTLSSGYYALLIVYQWNDGKKRKTDALGSIQVIPLPQANETYDARSVAQKALEDCEAALAKFNASGGRVQSYSIAGRSMTFTSVSELISLINYWRSRVRLETNNGIERRIRYVRF